MESVVGNDGFHQNEKVLPRSLRSFRIFALHYAVNRLYQHIPQASQLLLPTAGIG